MLSVHPLRCLAALLVFLAAMAAAPERAQAQVLNCIGANTPGTSSFIIFDKTANTCVIQDGFGFSVDAGDITNRIFPDGPGGGVDEIQGLRGTGPFAAQLGFQVCDLGAGDLGAAFCARDEAIADGSLSLVLENLEGGVTHRMEVEITVSGGGSLFAIDSARVCTGSGAAACPDTTAPGVVISGVPALTNVPFTATFTFSEPVTGFVLGDITVGNGAASAFTGGGGDTVYTALITPAADGAVTVDVAAGIAQDAATNGNTVAAQATTAFDGTAPGVVIAAPATATGPFTATFTFDEAVNGFTLGDITVGNGAASAFTGVNGDTVYTALITPTLGANSTVTLDVAAAVATDLAGNPNTAPPPRRRQHSPTRLSRAPAPNG